MPGLRPPMALNMVGRFPASSSSPAAKSPSKNPAGAQQILLTGAATLQQQTFVVFVVNNRVRVCPGACVCVDVLNRLSLCSGAVCIYVCSAVCVHVCSLVGNKRLGCATPVRHVCYCSK